MQETAGLEMKECLSLHSSEGKKFMMKDNGKGDGRIWTHTEKKYRRLLVHQYMKGGKVINQIIESPIAQNFFKIIKEEN